MHAGKENASDRTTTELTSLMNPSCSIDFLTRLFLTSTNSTELSFVSSEQRTSRPEGKNAWLTHL